MLTNAQRFALGLTGGAALVGALQAQILVQLDEVDWTAFLSGPVVTEDFNDQTEEIIFPPNTQTPLGLFTLEPAGGTLPNSFLSSGDAPNNSDGTPFLDLGVSPPFFDDPGDRVILRFDDPITDFAFIFSDFFAPPVTEGVDIYVDGNFVTNTRLEGIVPVVEGTNFPFIPPTFIGLNGLAPFSEVEFRNPDALTFETFSVDNLQFSDIFRDEDVNLDGEVDAFDLAIFEQLIADQDPSADLNNDTNVDQLDLDLFITAAFGAS
ncbi:MAG: dockerin type I domain-containing protein [Planctomycetota bacterium]